MIRALPFLAAVAALAACCAAQEVPTPAPPATPPAERAKIDVVFVLDTTGSMSGLIEGAKQKIWAIANAIATAEETPDIRMGLVAYRDRGDEYVTRRTALTADLDAVYSDLMKFAAAGGGDGPESVNQAIAEAIHQFEWTAEKRALKLVYLVGDAPPHMDYEQDVPYPTTCKQAAEAGIIINTIQCGASGGTRDVWQKIARGAEGEYFAIDQSGGMTAVATPFDSRLAALSSEMDSTLIGYGAPAERRALTAKLAMSREIEEAADEGALADRAAYKASAAGGESLTGGRELVSDLEAEKVDLAELDAGALPEEMKTMTVDERKEFVAGKKQERERLQVEIQDLSRKRNEFVQKELAAKGEKGDAFDQKVLEALRRQAAAKGIVYDSQKEEK